MIEVRELRKSYGATVAVDGVSFRVERGETFGLLGPNGAGKTTILHLLIGALRPDGGTILIDGADDPTRVAVRARLGIAPQTLALYEVLSAEENLTFFGKLYGLRGSALKERVAWALELAGLVDRRRHRVGTFSGGMKRRLNLACALAHDPAVVFLDEPTAGVDPQSRHHLFETIERLASAGLTILYTTHYIEEAERLCDRVAILEQGKILALDTVHGLVAAHGGQGTVEVELEEVPTDRDRLPGQLEGNVLRVPTDRPLEETARLAGLGLKCANFQLKRPNLETVFLNLTGRRLRD